MSPEGLAGKPGGTCPCTGVPAISAPPPAQTADTGRRTLARTPPGPHHSAREPPRPAPEPVAVTPVPGLAARTTALDFYYAQLDYHRTHRRWATTFAELNWSAPAVPSALATVPVFTPSSDATGYEFSVPFTDGSQRRAWTIRQDRHLALETPP